MTEKTGNISETSSDGILVSSDDEFYEGLSEAVGEHIEAQESKSTSGNMRNKTNPTANLNTITILPKNKPGPDKNITKPKRPNTIWQQQQLQGAKYNNIFASDSPYLPYNFGQRPMYMGRHPRPFRDDHISRMNYYDSYSSSQNGLFMDDYCPRPSMMQRPYRMNYDQYYYMNEPRYAYPMSRVRQPAPHHSRSFEQARPNSGNKATSSQSAKQPVPKEAKQTEDKNNNDTSNNKPKPIHFQVKGKEKLKQIHPLDPFCKDTDEDTEKKDQTQEKSSNDGANAEKGMEGEKWLHDKFDDGGTPHEKQKTMATAKSQETKQNDNADKAAPPKKTSQNIEENKKENKEERPPRKKKNRKRTRPRHRAAKKRKAEALEKNKDNSSLTQNSASKAKETTKVTIVDDIIVIDDSSAESDSQLVIAESSFEATEENEENKKQKIKKEEGEISPEADEDELLSLRLAALTSASENLDNKAIRADLEEWISQQDNLDLEAGEIPGEAEQRDGKDAAKDTKKPQSLKTSPLDKLVKNFINSKSRRSTPKAVTLGAEILKNKPTIKQDNKRLEDALKQLRSMPNNSRSVELFVKLMKGMSPSHVIKEKKNQEKRKKMSPQNTVDNYDAVEMEVDEGEVTDSTDTSVKNTINSVNIFTPNAPFVSPSVLMNPLPPIQPHVIGNKHTKPNNRRLSDEYDEDSLREILLKQLHSKRKAGAEETKSPEKPQPPPAPDATAKPPQPPTTDAPVTKPATATITTSGTSKNVAERVSVTPPLPNNKENKPMTSTKINLKDPRLYKIANPIKRKVVMSPHGPMKKTRKVNKGSGLIPLPVHQPVVINLEESSDEETSTPSFLTHSSVDNLIQEMRKRVIAVPASKANIYKDLEEKVAILRAAIPVSKSSEPAVVKKDWPFSKTPAPNKEDAAAKKTGSWPFAKDVPVTSVEPASSSSTAQVCKTAAKPKTVSSDTVGKKIETIITTDRNKNQITIKNKLDKVHEEIAKMKQTISVASNTPPRSSSAVKNSLQLTPKGSSSAFLPVAKIIPPKIKEKSLIALNLEVASASKSTSPKSTSKSPPGPSSRNRATSSSSSKSTSSSSRSRRKSSSSSEKRTAAPSTSSSSSKQHSNSTVTSKPAITRRVSVSRRRSVRLVSFTKDKNVLGLAAKVKTIRRRSVARGRTPQVVAATKTKAALLEIRKKKLAVDLPVRLVSPPKIKSVIVKKGEVPPGYMDKLQESISKLKANIDNVNKQLEQNESQILKINAKSANCVEVNKNLYKKICLLKKHRKANQEKIEKYDLERQAKVIETTRFLTAKERMLGEIKSLWQEVDKLKSSNQNKAIEKPTKKTKLLETKNTLAEQQQVLQKKIEELRNQTAAKQAKAPVRPKKKRYSLSDDVTNQLLTRKVIKQENPNSDVLAMSKIAIDAPSPEKKRTNAVLLAKEIKQEPDTGDSHTVKPSLKRMSISKDIKSENLNTSINFGMSNAGIVALDEDDKPVESKELSKEDFRELFIKKLTSVEETNGKALDDTIPRITGDQQSSNLYANIIVPFTNIDAKTTNEVDTTNTVTFEKTSFERYTSPLVHYRSYRLSPFYRRLSNFSIASKTFSHKINPFKTFCRFDLTGSCKDPNCVNQHADHYMLSHDELILDLLSYHEALLGEEMDKKELKNEDILKLAHKKAEELCSITSGVVSNEEFYVLLVGKINEYCGRKGAVRYSALPARTIRPPALPLSKDDFINEDESIEIAEREVVDHSDAQMASENRYCATNEKITDIVKTIVDKTPHDIQQWIKVAKKSLNMIKSTDTDTLIKKKMEVTLHNLSLALEHNPESEIIWCFYLDVLKQRCESNPKCVAAKQDYEEMLSKAVNIVQLSTDIWQKCFTYTSTLNKHEWYYQQLINNLVSRADQEDTALSAKYSHWLLTTLLSYVQLQLEMDNLDKAVSLLEAHSRNLSLKHQEDDKTAVMKSTHLVKLWLCYIHLIEFNCLPDEVMQNACDSSDMPISIHIPSSVIVISPHCDITIPFSSTRKLQKELVFLQEAFRNAVSKCSTKSSTLAENTYICFPLYVQLISLYKYTKEYEQGIDLSKNLLEIFTSTQDSEKKYHNEIMKLQDLCIGLMALSDIQSVKLTQMFDSFITDHPWNACICSQAANYQMKQVSPPDKEAAMMYYEATLSAYLEFEAQGEMEFNEIQEHLKYLLNIAQQPTIPMRPSIADLLEQQKPYLWICYCQILLSNNPSNSTEDQGATALEEQMEKICMIYKQAMNKQNSQEHRDIIWKSYTDHCVEAINTVSDPTRQAQFHKLLSHTFRKLLDETPTYYRYDDGVKCNDYTKHNQLIDRFVSIHDATVHSQIYLLLNGNYPANIPLAIKTAECLQRDGDIESIPSVLWLAGSSTECKVVKVWKMKQMANVKTENYAMANKAMEKAIKALPFNKEIWDKWLGMLYAFGMDEEMKSAKSTYTELFELDAEDVIKDNIQLLKS